MPSSATARAAQFHDATAEFIHAVSLLAALEGATGQPGHGTVLPFLGMARSELTDFGQRRPAHYILIQVDDLEAGLLDLDERLTLLLARSDQLQDGLRVESARRMLRRGMTAAGRTVDAPGARSTGAC